MIPTYAANWVTGVDTLRSLVPIPLVSTKDRHDSSLGVSLLSDRRQSSPQVVPSLPLIEIRRPSALSQFELGNFVNSPDMTGSEASECAPLLMKSSNGTQISSRKSSDGKSHVNLSYFSFVPAIKIFYYPSRNNWNKHLFTHAACVFIRSNYWVLFLTFNAHRTVEITSELFVMRYSELLLC